MKTIYKYNLPIGDFVEINLPLNSTCLSVGLQGDSPRSICLWVLVDPHQEIVEKRKFRIAGTGHSINEVNVDKFLGTVIQQSPWLVFHVFEVI